MLSNALSHVIVAPVASDPELAIMTVLSALQLRCDAVQGAPDSHLRQGKNPGVLETATSNPLRANREKLFGPDTRVRLCENEQRRRSAG